MTKRTPEKGRWNPKRQRPKRRIYNPVTKTYYILRQKRHGTGSIIGKYVPE